MNILNLFDRISQTEAMCRPSRCTTARRWRPIAAISTSFRTAKKPEKSFSDIGKVMSVPCIGIVQLFRKEHIRIEDHVVVKIDIEGAEYDLLRRIITSGLYRYIDKIAVEWHHGSYYVLGEPGSEDPKYESRLANHKKYKERYHSLLWMLDDLKGGPKLYDWA